MSSSEGVPASPSGHSAQAPEPVARLGHSASVLNAERLLHRLIEAARMYEASCRMGGKYQHDASLSLDRAKAAAMAAITG